MSFKPRDWQIAAALKFAACAAAPRPPGEAARAIVTAWMGSGKCVTPDTLVWSAGLRRFSEVRDLGLRGIRAHDIVRSITGWHDDGVRRGAVVRTRSGHEVNGTLKHPLWVRCDDGFEGWRKIGDLTGKEWVALARGRADFGDEHLREDESYALGLLVADGCVSPRNGGRTEALQIDKQRPQLERILPVLQEWCSATSEKSVARVHDVSPRHSYAIYQGKGIRSFLKQRFDIDWADSHERRVPGRVLRSGRDSVRAFLRGYFDGDGYAENGCVAVSTASKALADEVSALLMGLGIFHGRRVKKTKKRDAHVLVVYDLDAFDREVGFTRYGVLKDQNYDCLLARPRNTNVDVVPGLWHLIRSVAGRMPSKVARADAWAMHYHYSRTLRPSFAMLRSFVDGAPACPERDEMARVLYEHYAWSPIESITPSVAHRIDCEVETSHSFVGNGFVNHNTELAFLIAQNLGHRVLFIVNTDALATQTERRARAVFDHVGLVKAGNNDTGANFVVASLQTIADPARLAALVASEDDAGPFDLIVVDECHGTFEGGSAARVLEAFRARPALGLTATAWRLDKKDLGEVWKDGIVYKYGRKSAERDGVIVPVCDGEGNLHQPRVVVADDVDVKAAIEASKAGDKEAEKAAYGKHAWPAVAREIELMVGKGRRCIAFCPDVDSSRQVADLAKQLGVRAEHVDGDTKKRERDRILRDHRAGLIDAVVNCNLLTTGYDDPGIGGCVWARATDSWSLFWQAVGRIIRSAPGKTSAMLTDMAGAWAAHGSEAAETLFMGEDTPELSAEDAKKIGEGGGGAEDRQTAVWRGFLSALAGKRLLQSARGAKVAWLPVGRADDAYAFGGSDGAIYMLEQGAGGLWSAFREPRERGRPAVKLTGEVSLQAAQEIAEHAARAGEGFDSREADWREKEAGPKVLEALKKFRVSAPPGIKSGEASDALVVTIAKMNRRSRRQRGVALGGGAAFE